MQRRELMRQGYQKAVLYAAQQIDKKINKVTGHRTKLVRPPGAIPEDEFLRACTKCKLCAEACPPQAIRIAGPEMGLAHEGYPLIDIPTRACYMCSEMPCVAACPEPALIDIEPQEIFLGKVEIHPQLCLAFFDEDCISCDYSCPVPGALEFVDKKPKIDPTLCTGCGLCIQSCVAKPAAIQYIARKWSLPSFRLNL